VTFLPARARTLVLACLAGLAAACAARGPAPSLAAEIGRAQVLQQDGCYECLLEALAIYERVAAAPRPPASAARGAFATAVMLVVRSKELGLPSETPLSRAETLAKGLPATAGGLAPAAYIAAATAFVGETSGLDPEIRQQRTRRARGRDGAPIPLPERRALDAAAPGDALAAYLALALDCETVSDHAALDRDALLARWGRTNALRFRLAICNLSPGDLQPLRGADPRWRDTLFFEGRREMTARPLADVAKAVTLFSDAHAAFPQSHAITLALAAAQNAVGSYEPALALYDSVLADEPSHRDAWLGRVMSLSYLNRYVDGVEAATRMIELGTWHIGDAYYWRAWNRYQLHQLPLAWADVEQAATLLVNSSVYTLAGYVAYARIDLGTAIARFDRAFALDSTNCEAVWFAALVHIDQQAWSDAAPKFSRAMTCFAAAAAEARAEIARLDASNAPEAARVRPRALAQKRVDTAEHRAAQAAFNAASAYLRLGQRALALTHVDAALAHPLLRDKAAALKAQLEKEQVR
jgi:tetratricopeptide (TPR) repeat protein